MRTSGQIWNHIMLGCDICQSYNLIIHLIVGHVRHLLIVFGGLSGLEESIEEDNNLKVYIKFKNTIQ
jgi:hypothetical protein